MSTIDIIIPERAADLGNFLVGRILPFRQKRMVGPFIFIDHMGPVNMDERQTMDIEPHPHIGLATLTYLFDGSIQHKDSLGNDLEITPGAVNWMSAGKGIVHSERTPERLRNQAKTMHGLQIWIALPKELEDGEPHFQHVTAAQIPQWNIGSTVFKLIAGELNARKSPVSVNSKLYFIEIKTVEAATIDLSNVLYGESGLYVLEGSVHIGENNFTGKELLVTKEAHLCQFEMGANSTVYLFGGEPLPEERLIDWNFVSSKQETIDAAKALWKAHGFPKVPGDDGYVPYPERKV